MCAALQAQGQNHMERKKKFKGNFLLFCRKCRKCLLVVKEEKNFVFSKLLLHGGGCGQKLCFTTFFLNFPFSIFRYLMKYKNFVVLKVYDLEKECHDYDLLLSILIWNQWEHVIQLHMYIRVFYWACQVSSLTCSFTVLPRLLFSS